jgi:hypothetical protein
MPARQDEVMVVRTLAFMIVRRRPLGLVSLGLVAAEYGLHPAR